MTILTPNYLDTLDKMIEEKHLLKNPFYTAWTRGELSKDCLKEYSKQYYHHVKAFPTYLSAVHSHTECQKTRRHLLENLIEEEAGRPNHPQLWRRFVECFGVSREDVENHEADAPILDLIHSFRTICKNHGVAEGIAALYAYESQIPAICESKIDGLKNHYNMTNPKDWFYFTLHIEADKEHAAIERKLLMKHITEDNFESVKAAVSHILDGLNNFLMSLCYKYDIAC